MKRTEFPTWLSFLPISIPIPIPMMVYKHAVKREKVFFAFFPVRFF